MQEPVCSGAGPATDPQKVDVSVLRLGHRLVRDERISTHVGLVSRAFGAKRLFLTGADDRTAESIRKITASWGGRFEVEYIRNWRELIRNWKGPVVHLTMYGENLDLALEKIRNEILKHADGGYLLLVVGAEKVPREIYSMASYNVSIGNQPHSEIAALAVFLDRLFMGAELNRSFEDARLRIHPSPRGKKVVDLLH
jgi:tRNA (cytidine56-2'-O)-methyltransferase